MTGAHCLWTQYTMGKLDHSQRCIALRWLQPLEAARQLRKPVCSCSSFSHRRRHPLL